jgi:hypothetical protein
MVFSNLFFILSQNTIFGGLWLRRWLLLLSSNKTKHNKKEPLYDTRAQQHTEWLKMRVCGSESKPRSIRGDGADVQLVLPEHRHHDVDESGRNGPPLEAESKAFTKSTKTMWLGVRVPLGVLVEEAGGDTVLLAAP